MNDPVNSAVRRIEPAPSTIRRAWASIVGRAARISIDETSVARRGFSVRQPEVAERLEAIGSHFVWGYNLAVGSVELRVLTAALSARPVDDAGFAYEGAAMGMAIADWLTPGRHMFDAYLAGPARHQEYMAWVGFGWALARLPVAPERALARYRTLNCWLALDGYGFHEGYFGWPLRIEHQRRPGALTADGLRIFDQGLGRSLWFVRGAQPTLIAQAIDAFSSERHGDLWAGVGLAAAYAGGCSSEQLKQLLENSDAHAPALAQGVIFAAQARRKAGNIVPHVELACNVLLGLDTLTAANLAETALPVGRHALEDYQKWRFAIQRQCIAVAPHLANQTIRERACPSSKLA